jgi:hypothetical protein
MIDKYTTETAALKATVGKFKKLDTNKLTINGKDISEIGGSVGEIKHAQDTRETVTENDLWGQWVETLEDGTVIIHDDWATNPNGTKAWNTSITKVEDNKAYDGNTLYGNIQSVKIKDGKYMFNGCRKLTSFSSDLSSLTNGEYMFNGCNKLTSFSSDLSNLKDGDMMFYGCRNLTSFTSDLSSLRNGDSMFSSCESFVSFSSDLSSLTNGDNMFYWCANIKSFSSDLPNLTNGKEMFEYCYNLTTFSSNLSSLTNGNNMFSSCEYLSIFSSDLPSLTYGSNMFSGCVNITTFTSDLPSLTNGSAMFNGCRKLTSFSSDLSSLTYGSNMFSSCEKLTSFSVDLSSLTNGSGMFEYCYNLTTFSSDLSSLTDGWSMFYKCKLNPQSVMYIIQSIKDIAAEKQLYTSGTIPYVTKSNGVYSAPKGFMSDGSYIYTYNNPSSYTTTIYPDNVGDLTIGIDVSNDANTIAQQLQDFAEGALFDSWADLKQAFVDKGWTVTWQYGGTVDSITYDLRDGERIIPCPVYTKLIEISPEGVELDENNMPVGDKFYTKEQKNGAEYCNEDGTRYYNIEWGHEVTNPEEFQQFDSLETACVTYGVMPKEYLETEGQATLF